jgi:1-aminocyclopropane-1-carboxylate deaminase
MAGAGITAATPSPLVPLVDNRLGSVTVLLKRDDLVHPVVTGNKWRKLKYLLEDAHASGAPTLLTFGGAYSNHVRALAAAGAAYGFRTVGVIRGEERPHNDGLGAAQAAGMYLHYLDRTTYRRKTEPDVINELRERFGDFLLVPEGGTTIHALRGCAELVDEIDRPFDIIACAVGTGGTLAGISAGLGPGRRALGVSVLKGAASLDETVADLQRDGLGRALTNWTIDHRHHHGGFARTTPALRDFLDDFEHRHGLRLGHVYVGKLMFALFALVADEEIPPASSVVAVVTGDVVDLRNRHDPELIV